VLNYVVKAAVLAFVVTLFLPRLRAELKGNAKSDRAEAKSPSLVQSNIESRRLTPHVGS
jgi:hypothetical protein